MNNNRNWALITGATSGIGLELSRLFAKDGYNLILVARNKNKLEQVKDELSHLSIEVIVFPCDLSQEEQVLHLCEKILDLELEIEVLINNAGAGKFGSLVETDITSSLETIHLNVTSLTLLTQVFAKKMVEKNRGHILLVSSTAAFGPDAGLNVYGPTKAYVYNFAQTLRAELSQTNVYVSCVCPGPTKTNWSKNAGRKDSSWAMEARKVAEITYRGFQKKRTLIIPGLGNKFLFGLSCIIPDSWIGMVTSSFQNRLKKD
ncbi:MAG: SDR family oxidoreductase [Bacillota bacterium]|nr:SDR family oxidoreductase [Bacillota bacterium]